MKKSLSTLIAATTLLASTSIYGSNIEPYSSVKTLPQTPYYVQDAYTIYSLINTHGSVVVVDVESQDGGVARYVAQQAANMPTSNLPTVQQIFSVSPWYSCDPSQKHLFQRFLSNVTQEMTTQMITPIRMNSQEAAESLNITADFISLVGKNQSDSIYNDILAWAPHLSNNGVLCGNNWYDHSVQHGVSKAAVALDMTLQTNNNVWYFVKGQ
jgi:hypothetical protein